MGVWEICFVTQCLSSITRAGGHCTPARPSVRANKSGRAAAYTTARPAIDHPYWGFTHRKLCWSSQSGPVYIHNSPKNHHVTSPPAPVLSPSAVQTVGPVVCVGRGVKLAPYTRDILYICLIKEDRRRRRPPSLPPLIIKNLKKR